MKKSNLRETIKKTIKEMMSGGMLNEAQYCNGAGQDPATHTNCHERGVGCLNMEDGYFGVMGQCVTCDPEWACVSVAPGGPDSGPTLDPGVRGGTKDPKFNDPNLMSRGRLNEIENCDDLGNDCTVQVWVIHNTGGGANEERCGTVEQSSNGGCFCGSWGACGKFVPGGGGELDADRVAFKGIPPHGTGPTNPDLIKKATRNMLTRTGEGCTEDFECQSSSEPNGCCEGGVCTTCGDMLSEAEICWFGRANYANSGYTCVARGCNFTGPTNNPSGWADINDGAGYENVHECNQWMAVMMTGGNPGTNNPTLYATNFVRSTDRPSGGGEISMDRMMREAIKNILKND